MAPQARELRLESSTDGHTDRVKQVTVDINLIKNTENIYYKNSHKNHSYNSCSMRYILYGPFTYLVALTNPIEQFFNTLYRKYAYLIFLTNTF